MKRKGGPPKLGSIKPPAKEQDLVLDHFSALDVTKAADFRDKYLQFHWDFYSALAHQRAKIMDKLQQSLSLNSISPFEVKSWQRAVRWKYSNHPLCTQGSIIEPGGRFNIPDIDSSKFPIFPALYIAEDKKTALTEMLGQDVKGKSGLSRLDSALAKETSISCVSVNAYLESVIDLSSPSRLQDFVDLIRGFEIPSSLERAAKALGIPLNIVRSPQQLLETLLFPNWRVAPMQQDVPANSQVFGQIALAAGLEGVLYPSKMNGKKCLAIFIQNFENSASYVSITDEPPSATTPVRIDSTSWKQFL